MIILSIKTDQPESEFKLFKNKQVLGSVKYLAHRDLGVTIHSRIYELLKKQNIDWSDLEGVICFKGPGSFTGLRIGLSVANALAYSLNVPIIGSEGNDWQEDALQKLLSGLNDKKVIPEYGSEPHITQPKK